jgi:hypothetical protein
VPYLARADKSLALGNCEELAFNVASIVYEFSWPNRFQPHLAGQMNSGKTSPLTLGMKQLIQYAEESPTKYTGEKMLGLMEVLANDESYEALNRLELEPIDNNPKTYRYRIGGEELTIDKKSLINAIFRERKNIRNSNTS